MSINSSIHKYIFAYSVDYYSIMKMNNCQRWTSKAAILKRNHIVISHRHEVLKQPKLISADRNQDSGCQWGGVRYSDGKKGLRETLESLLMFYFFIYSQHFFNFDFLLFKFLFLLFYDLIFCCMCSCYKMLCKHRQKWGRSLLKITITNKPPQKVSC